MPSGAEICRPAFVFGNWGRCWLVRKNMIKYRDALFASIDLALKIFDDFLRAVVDFEGRDISFKITDLLLISLPRLEDLLLVRLDAVMVFGAGSVDVQSRQLAPQLLRYRLTRAILRRGILDATRGLQPGTVDGLGAPLFDGRVRGAPIASRWPLGRFALALLIQNALVFACVPRDRRDRAAFALDHSLIGGVVETAFLPAVLHQQMLAAIRLDEDGVPSRSGMRDLLLDPAR